MELEIRKLHLNYIFETWVHFREFQDIELNFTKLLHETSIPTNDNSPDPKFTSI